MVFLPRLPNNEDSLRKHEASSGTAAAGSVVFLTESGTIAKVAASGNVPYGFLFANVDTQIPGLPQNFQFPGELGTADARLGDPVLVYVEGGQFETDHYVYEGSAGINAGDLFYAAVGTAGGANDGKLVNSDSPTDGTVANGENGAPKAVAKALEPLTDAEATAGKRLLVQHLI